MMKISLQQDLIDLAREFFAIDMMMGRRGGFSDFDSFQAEVVPFFAEYISAFNALMIEAMKAGDFETAALAGEYVEGIARRITYSYSRE